MTTRRVKIVLLCEDSQHEAFARRFLKGMGWNTREIRVEKSPCAGGSAEQWVRENFPIELEAYRKRRQKAVSVLIAVTDADNMGVQSRITGFEAACSSRQTPFPGADEAVAIVVPRRNIETWIHYLNGELVDESCDYPKLQRARDCKLAVDQLVKMCKSSGLPTHAPPSLAAACNEYLRVKSLVRDDIR